MVYLKVIESTVIELETFALSPHYLILIIFGV